jgi:transcriptional regulator with GAF, ATPase, and Fis domain
MMPARLESRRTIQKLRVEFIETPDADKRGKAFTFVSDEVRIGSSPDADLAIQDPTLSREHLAIRRSEHGWLLTDLGSTNGTRVGDLRIERAEIQNGAVVEIASTKLRLAPDEQVEQELSSHGHFGRMIGASPAMRAMFAVLEKVAGSDLTVLIEGETGTGKELAAEALHQKSGRQGPFVTLNCGAIPRELIESELMGHVKGAFTGAVADRDGAFVSADGGTLFLDEVGELPLDMQAKLLRVLERREVKPVGSDRSVAVDVRVVAATNRNLAHEAERGQFRQDLYFRLAVVVVRIPPLRTRLEDLPMLVEHVQAELNRRRVAAGNAPLSTLGERAIEMLRRYDFPGNVRELRNIVERWSVLGPQAPGTAATIGAPGGTLAVQITGAPESPPDTAVLGLPYHEAKEAWVERFERAYVAHILEQAGGNVSQAARDAQVDRRHLQRLMARYDIRK